MADLEETFEGLMKAVRTTADDPAKRKEIHEVLETVADKLAETTQR